MATPGGYDYTKSLLDVGNGPIRAMSGGGDGDPPTNTYNAGASLIQHVAAENAPIIPVRGGFLDGEGIVLSGGEGNPGTKSTIGQERVEKALQIKSQVGSTTGTAAPDTTAPLPGESATPVVVPTTTVTSTTGTAANTVATGPPSDGSGNTSPSKKKFEITTKEPLAEGENKTKDIILFGESITLENPDNNEPFTESQIKALKAFGLEGPGVNDSQKREILKAIYERKCNSDKPLAMLEQCEPVRRIVQSLALNLLSKLGTNGKPSLNITKEEVPDVNYEKLGDGSMKVSILFKPGQLGLLSKFKPEVVKKNNSDKNKPGSKPPNSDNNSGSGGTPAFNTGLPNPPTTTPVVSTDAASTAASTAASVVNSTSSAASVPGESIDELKLNEELESILEEIKTFKETNNSNPENLKQTITKFSNNIKNIKSTANENKNLNNKLEEVAAFLESTTNKSLTKQNIANMEEELEDFHKFLNALPQTGSKDVSKSGESVKSNNNSASVQSVKSNNNNSASVESVESNNESVASSESNNELVASNNESNIISNEYTNKYKDCKFTQKQLDEKYKIIGEISDNNDNKFDIMEIPDDGWCLYSAIQRSKNGKFSNNDRFVWGGNYHSFIPELINRIALYLQINKDIIQEKLDILKLSNEKPRTQPIKGEFKYIETVDEYIKYLTAPRENINSHIPSDAKVKCNEKDEEGFVYKDSNNNQIKFASIKEGPALWPDLQIVGDALVFIYNKPIYIFEKDETGKLKEYITIKNPNNNSNDEGIYLLYNGTNHYDALLPKFKGIPESIKNNNKEKNQNEWNKARNLAGQAIKEENKQEENNKEIDITPNIANPLKTKLGQLKSNFSNLTRIEKNKTKTNKYQRQAAAVNSNMKKLTPGKKMTQKNLNAIKEKLNKKYNSVQGGKRKTFKKANLKKKRTTSITMKKQKKQRKH
jgi:hypothetical protein